MPRPPDDPRLVFARAVFSGLASGRVESLVDLADPLAVRKAAGCENVGKSGLNLDPQQEFVAAVRKDMVRVATRSKGMTIDVLAVVDGDARTVAKGTQIADGCKTRIDLAYRDLKVKLRVRRQPNPAVEQEALVRALELNDRWYLVALPGRLDDGVVTKYRKLIASMTEFADRMCRCSDKACADPVMEDYTKWGNELVKDLEIGSMSPDADEMTEITAIATRFSTCAVKAMTAP